MSRKNLSYSAVWIKNTFLPDETDEDWATLVYSHPMALAGQRRIPVVSPIFSGKEALLVSSHEDTFTALLAGEKVKKEGGLIVFSLGEIGVLKLFSPVRLSEEEMNQLKTLIPKFTTSIEGCLAYQQTLKKLAHIKAAEEKLRLYKFMVESAHDAIFFKDLESRYIIANQKTLDAFALSEQEVIGKNDYELMPDAKEAKKNVDDDRIVFKQGKPTEVTKHMAAADGTERWFQAVKVPQFDVQGNVVGLVGIARDVTENKLLEIELTKHRDHLQELVTKKTAELVENVIKAERLATAVQIAGEAAHEVKNPLAVIKAGLYYLERILPPDNKAQKTLSQMDEATERATNYINDLLNFSKPPELKKSRMNINEMIKKAMDELPPEILSNIYLQQELAGDLPDVLADFDKLKQVVVNLVKNAAEAIREVKIGRLKVKSEKEGEFIKISVSDTGKGIKEEDIGRIFDPFFTTKGIGTGLGLSICQRITEAHKGEIEVKSKIGEGTTFVVKLPIH
jgi:PAS domain S-box-containing protein